MALERIADRIVETDVLVVGGGIAGCPAAAKAAENGLKVTLAEKSKLDRSGSAAQGIDGYMGPFARGITPKDFQKILDDLGARAFFGGVPYADPTMLYKIWANWEWTVEELEKLGVTMKWDDGKLLVFDVSAHGSGKGLRVHWMRVKPQMAAGVRKRGVNVLERTMIIDLLTSNGTVVGATALDTRTGEFIVIKAKATIMATASFSRCYTPETPMPWKYKFNYHWCPASVSGDGWAMVYRAGAELASMEQAGRGYRFRDDMVLSYGNVRGHGVEAALYTWDGEEIGSPGSAAPSPRGKLAQLEDEGREPFYYSLNHLPDDFQKRVESAYVDERLVSFKIAEDRGFNPKTHWYEMIDSRPNQVHTPPGINADGDFRATLKGLYAIGDCVAGIHSVAEAAACGFLVAESMPGFVSEAAEPAISEAQVESQKQAALAPLKAKGDTESIELESTIRYICDRYVGLFKSEGKLREGLRRIGSLRREFLPRLIAKNPHQLMRCLEVRNIMDAAELHIQSSLERNETRGMHVRLDCLDQDPSLEDKLLYQRLEDGKQVVEFRKRAPMTLAEDHKEDR